MNQIELNRLYQWSDFLKTVNVNVYASVEGKKWFNEQLLTERLNVAKNQLSFIDSSIIQYYSSENWKMMQEQILDNQINTLKNKSQEDIKKWIKSNPSVFIDSLLLKQRATHIYSSFDTLLEVKNIHDYLFAKNYDTSLDFKNLNWNRILIDDYIIPNKRLTTLSIIPLKNNVIKTNLLGALTVQESFKQIDSSDFELIMNDIDFSNQKQIFNLSILHTQYWFENYTNSFYDSKIANTIAPNDLLDIYKKLDTAQYNDTILTLLKLNIILSGIHYYNYHNKWEEVNEYFDKIYQTVVEGHFTSEQAEGLALFCNYFHKFDLSVKILHPYHIHDELSESGKFTLAKTSTLIQDKLDKKDYHAYMLSAKRANLKKYCQWLDTSFQIQRDEFLKVNFCQSCK